MNSKIKLLVTLAIIFLAFVIFVLAGKDGKVEVIDGCQYIQTWTGYGYNLTHKGNCTNQIHQVIKIQ